MSAVAVSASKNLLRALIDYENKENLNFNGYPPELAIYKKAFLQNNIHGWSGSDFRILDTTHYKDEGQKLLQMIFMIS